MSRRVSSLKTTSQRGKQPVCEAGGSRKSEETWIMHGAVFFDLGEECSDVQLVS